MPLPGTVVLTSAKHVTTVPVSSSGHFSVKLAAGTYEVHGTSPQTQDGKGLCRAQQTVTVRSGSSTSVEVICGVR